MSMCQFTICSAAFLRLPCGHTQFSQFLIGRTRLLANANPAPRRRDVPAFLARVGPGEAKLYVRSSEWRLSGGAQQGIKLGGEYEGVESLSCWCAFAVHVNLRVGV